MRKAYLFILAIVASVACSVEDGYEYMPDSDSLVCYAENLLFNKVQSYAIDLDRFALVDCYVHASPQERKELPQLVQAENWLIPVDEETVQIGLAGVTYHTYGTSFYEKDCNWRISYYHDEELYETGYTYQSDSTWTCGAATVRFHGWDDDGCATTDVTPGEIVDTESSQGLTASLKILGDGTIRFVDGKYSEGSYRVEVFCSGEMIDWVEIEHSASGSTYRTSRD